MPTAASTIAPPSPVARRPLYGVLASGLLLVGLAGHLLAARLIGSGIAYRDHIGGFCLIAVVTGLPLLLLERFFWRGRRDVTWLVFGVLQAALGVVIYILRPGVH